MDFHKMLYKNYFKNPKEEEEVLPDHSQNVENSNPFLPNRCGGKDSSPSIGGV